MLMTNDGTKGDLVFNKLCLSKKQYKFYFWFNGVNKTIDDSSTSEPQSLLNQLNIKPDDRLLLYPARYDPWKRQELAIAILHKLSIYGDHNFKLLFCGHKYDVKYYNNLIDLVTLYGLKGHVIFSEPFNPPVLHKLMTYSFATLSFYEFSNLGNVMIEASLAGSFIITIRDGSTDFLIENDVTGLALPLTGDYVSSIAHQIIQYSANEVRTKKIRQNLKKRADEFFLTWEQRSHNEIELIENSIKNQILS